jgi:type II secretory pathway pseudopilin PulG
MMIPKRSEVAFTPIELLVVIAILAAIEKL